jgi:hypothetical protein
LRDIARRQPLPGYSLSVLREGGGRELLAFVPTGLSTAPCGQAVETLVPSGTAGHVLSGTGGSCYQEPKTAFSSANSNSSDAPNLESNLKESNPSEVGHRCGRWITGTRAR